MRAVESDRRRYTIGEAAALLQFHPDAVRYWVRVGELVDQIVNHGASARVLLSIMDQEARSEA